MGRGISKRYAMQENGSTRRYEALYGGREGKKCVR